MTTYTETFDFMPFLTPQQFLVPSDVTSVIVECWGAEGESYFANTGGLGGYIKAEIATTPGEALNLGIGIKPTTEGWSMRYAGGWGGGSYGRTGGAGSGVYRGSTDLVVAGGGGGAGAGNFHDSTTPPVGARGGDGGAATGQSGTNGGATGTIGGGGGTQSSGGAGGAGYGGYNGTAGSLRVGGNGGGTYSWYGGSGGGGGWRGGGGGGGGGPNNSGSGGGGGSNGTTGTLLDSQRGVRTGNGRIAITFTSDVPLYYLVLELSTQDSPGAREYSVWNVSCNGVAHGKIISPVPPDNVSTNTDAATLWRENRVRLVNFDPNVDNHVSLGYSGEGGDYGHIRALKVVGPASALYYGEYPLGVPYHSDVYEASKLRNGLNELYGSNNASSGRANLWLAGDGDYPAFQWNASVLDYTSPVEGDGRAHLYFTIPEPVPAAAVTAGIRKPPSQRNPEFNVGRQKRAIESMAPGSMGGRVTNASRTAGTIAAATGGTESTLDATAYITFRSSDALTVGDSTPYRVVGAQKLASQISLSLGTAGSTATTVVVKKNGVAFATLTANAAATSQTVSTTEVLMPGDVIYATITSVGAGASQLTVQVKTH